MTGGERPWWQRAVIYQIYPRSFQDSNGDGIGDLNGISARADYLAWLGVDAVWISPIYPSPMADFGYDISDYVGIDPIFGTLDDFDRMLAALHRRQIRVILDLVPNHTTIEHHWFQASRQSRQNPKRNWYIWRDPAPDGGLPNNWLSYAGGKAWTFDEATGQYYYHAFLESQPDLNWRNPEVREAIHNVMRFWLDRGVDGYRVDVLWQLAKDAEFRDDPLNPNYKESDPPFTRVLPNYSADQPEIMDYAAEMASVMAGYPGERVLIGELSVPLERLMAYYGAVHMPFNFSLLWAAWTREGWTAARIKRLVERYEGALPPGAWPNWVIGNHDQPRIATRLGAAQARVAMVLLLTLRGTPTLYYADELGHPSVPIPPERVRDPFGINMPGGSQGRDPVRTPIPWDRSPNAGFTAGEPWLPLVSNSAEICVEAQKADPASMLALTRSLLDLRRRKSALNSGDFALIPTEGGTLAYIRSAEGRRFAVVMDIESRPARVKLGMEGQILLGTRIERSREAISGEVEIAADEAVVIAIT